MYLDIQPPAAKGDDDVWRAKYPKILKLDQVVIPAFEEFLATEKPKKGANHSKLALGLRRILGFLEVVPNAKHMDVHIGDCEVMVSLCRGRMHTKLLDSPLMGTKFTWTPLCVAGLNLYLRYHKNLLVEKLLQQDESSWPQYKDVLDKFIGDIEDSWTKRCHEHAATMHQRKQASDLNIIKQIKIPALQGAVYKGYATLFHIREHFGDAPLPKNIRGLANSVLTGGVCFDAFSGRKLEWEIMLWMYVQGVLEKNGDHFVCSQHKTAKTYGSIAKYLPPGLAKAFKVYAALHRPAGFKYFFVPARTGTAKVSFPNSLKTFLANFLDPGHVTPTFNIMRKLFHKALRTIGSDEEALKELMVILDAHSKAVQGTHYILRDPEDDVKLAKQLVKVVLKDTVAFPEKSRRR